MAIGRVPGFPDYTNAGSSRYIPIVFSTKALRRFYEVTVINEITTTEYLGEITKGGDTVVVRTQPDVTIRDYNKGQDLLLENPESPAIELTIDKAKYFNFALDDVDEKQFDIKWIDKWAENAAKRLKITIETGFFTDLATAVTSATAMDQQISAYNVGATAGKLSAAINLGTAGAALSITRANILDLFVYANQVLDEQNAPEGKRWIVIPAWMAAYIKLSDLKDASFAGSGKSFLLNGRIGEIDGITIYKSNLLYTSSSKWYVPFGCAEALAFATQLTKTEMYRPQNTFANAMKGLQVYAHKIIYPNLVGSAVVSRG